jgi:large subunit ribosomal protein L5
MAKNDEAKKTPASGAGAAGASAGGAGAAGASAGGAGAATGAKEKPGKSSSAAGTKPGGSSKGSGGTKPSAPSAKAGDGPPKSATGAAAGEAKPYVPRLRRRYLEEVVPKLKREFSIENTMAVPRLERISLNMGMGEAIQNIKILDDAVEEMSALAGQRPTITRAQKSIAAFKLRAGMPIGCRVTLRGERMWDFLDRFISVALPRVRDFRGVSPKSFDGRGNYTMGIRDHLIFLEIDYNKVERPKGMNVTIVTTAGNDERALYLLRELGMPFAR